VAYGALCGRVFTFIDISANEASEFLFHIEQVFIVVFTNISVFSVTSNNRKAAPEFYLTGPLS
jgi:hypothetical protein